MFTAFRADFGLAVLLSFRNTAAVEFLQQLAETGFSAHLLQKFSRRQQQLQGISYRYFSDSFQKNSNVS